jgi:hypothetical protein
MKEPDKQGCRFIPTLSNEEIRKIPVFPRNTSRGRDLVLTEKGHAMIGNISMAWFNPFGGVRR